MKIYVGTDHNGFALKTALIAYLKKAGYDVVDMGEQRLDPDDDYPILAQRVVKNMLTSDDPEPRGVLFCGSGQGMCIAANRFKGIRAALGYDRESIRASRNDDDVNVLCLPARHLAKDETNMLVETFLNTPFSHVGRYQRRIRQIDEY